VARDEHAVLRADEVGLDVVGAHAGGEFVACERVLGTVARRAAMADDERLGVVVMTVAAVVIAAAAVSERRPGHDAGEQQDERGGDERPRTKVR